MHDPLEQACPVCAQGVRPNMRYPAYLCHDCSKSAVSPDGRPLEFFNLSLSGGYGARYADTGEPYPSHECLVAGIRCHADEARFGGIVIQAIS